MWLESPALYITLRDITPSSHHRCTHLVEASSTNSVITCTMTIRSSTFLPSCHDVGKPPPPIPLYFVLTWTRRITGRYVSIRLLLIKPEVFGETQWKLPTYLASVLMKAGWHSLQFVGEDHGEGIAREASSKRELWDEDETRNEFLFFGAVIQKPVKFNCASCGLHRNACSFLYYLQQFSFCQTS